MIKNLQNSRHPNGDFASLARLDIPAFLQSEDFIFLFNKMHETREDELIRKLSKIQKRKKSNILDGLNISKIEPVRLNFSFNAIDNSGIINSIGYCSGGLAPFKHFMQDINSCQSVLISESPNFEFLFDWRNKLINGNFVEQNLILNSCKADALASEEIDAVDGELGAPSSDLCFTRSGFLEPFHYSDQKTCEVSDGPYPTISEQSEIFKIEPRFEIEVDGFGEVIDNFDLEIDLKSGRCRDLIDIRSLVDDLNNPLEIDKIIFGETSQRDVIVLLGKLQWLVLRGLSIADLPPTKKLFILDKTASARVV